MKVYLYKLRFTSPVHFGETGIELENISEWIHSDTLFSALINAVKEYEGENRATELVKDFVASPPFIISSLFVYHGNTLFLPKPLKDAKVPEEVRKRMGKELKRLRWLDVEGFKRWTSDELLSIEEIEEMKEKEAIYIDAFVAEMLPKVTLDRDCQKSNIYHVGLIRFRNNAGLYGLVACKDEERKEEFKTYLQYLGDLGLGGERTYGCGRFEVKVFTEVSGRLKELFECKGDRYVLLSLYHPSSEELEEVDRNFLAYDLIKRRGWITTGRKALPLRRKTIGFLTEGSVSHKPLKGSLADVTPDSLPFPLSHRVYRYGYAFTVPMEEVV